MTTAAPVAATLHATRPLRVNYYPSPGQLAFHKDRTTPERLLQAGTGGGKTYCAAFEVIDLTLREPPGTAVLAAPDYPQLDLSVITTFRRLFGRDLATLEPYARYNAQRKTLRWWNGWEWRFASMDDPTSVEGLPEADLVWLNEARLVKGFSDPDGPWMNLTRRLRGKNDRLRRAIADTHSPSPGIQRIFKPLGVAPVKKTVRGGTYTIQDCEGGRRAFQWGTKDAMAWGTLSDADGRRLLAAYQGPAALRILEGKFARPGGLVFDAYTDANLRAWDGEAERFSYGVDWGWTHPTVLTVHAWLGDRVHTVAEWSRSKASDSEVADALAGLLDEYGAGFVWCGADRPEAIALLRSKRITAKAYVGKVDDGVTNLNSRLAAGSWLIDPSCKELLRGIEEWEREKDSGLVKKQDGVDDAPDSARYGIAGEGKTRRATAHSPEDLPSGDEEWEDF